jgi:hypothetical protein
MSRMSRVDDIHSFAPCHRAVRRKQSLCAKHEETHNPMLILHISARKIQSKRKIFAPSCLCSPRRHSSGRGPRHVSANLWMMMTYISMRTPMSWLFPFCCLPRRVASSSPLVVHAQRSTLKSRLMSREQRRRHTLRFCDSPAMPCLRFKQRWHKK